MKKLLAIFVITTITLTGCSSLNEPDPIDVPDEIVEEILDEEVVAFLVRTIDNYIFDLIREIQFEYCDGDALQEKYTIVNGLPGRYLNAARDKGEELADRTDWEENNINGLDDAMDFGEEMCRNKSRP